MPEWIEVKTAMGDVRGMRQEDIDAIRRHEAWKGRREAGEFWNVKVTRKRSGPVHRRFFKMLSYAFEHWDPGPHGKTYKGFVVAKEFESFREDILILAGYGEARYHVDGTISFKAKSISYDSIPDDEEFKKVYEAVQVVLLEHILTNYHKADLERVLNELERYGT